MEEEYSPWLVINYTNAIGRALEHIRNTRFEKMGEGLRKVKKSDPEKLLNIARGARDQLLKINSVFPFTLFPHSIVIDREKLTIANRSFFRTAKINSVPIEDILSVEANVGPIFGSVRISSRYFVANPQMVRFLWRSDAIKIQRMVQGYIIAREKDLDCSDISTEQLRTLLHELGRGVSD